MRTEENNYKCPKVKVNREWVRLMYLDYANNFLTVLMFANYYRLNEADALRVINIGRELHNIYVERRRNVGLLYKVKVI